MGKWMPWHNDESRFSSSSRVQETEDRSPSTDAMVDLEMDELNQHECMAAMIALVEHMQRSIITPKSEQVSGAGRSRQVWTFLLRSYDHILSIYKCIYLSIHLRIYPRDIIFYIIIPMPSPTLYVHGAGKPTKWTSSVDEIPSR